MHESNIVIDPTLESVCLPLAQDEFDTLEAQILRDGCLDPLKVWDREGELVLLDGHNRLKICNKHDLPYDTSTIEIESLEDAIIWIVDNQKGRRNVATQAQRDYISGKKYEAQKIINKRRDEKGVFKSDAPRGNDFLMGDTHNATAKIQAHDEGIVERTVRNNEKFANGIDAIREVSPRLVEKILKPDTTAPTLPKKVVSALPKIKEKFKKEPEKFVEAVKDIEAALDTKDKDTIEVVVRDHIKPGEPTHEEKMTAKRLNLKPEHVRYADEHNIPYEKLKTVEQLNEMNEQEKRACSTIWDGFYKCSCGIKFEIFGAVHAPVCCPHCESRDLKRDRGE